MSPVLLLCNYRGSVVGVYSSLYHQLFSCWVLRLNFYYLPSFRKFINNILSQLIMKLFRIKLSELNLMGRLGVKANYLFFQLNIVKTLLTIYLPKIFKRFYFVEHEETNLKLNINLSKHFVSSEESF